MIIWIHEQRNFVIVQSPALEVRSKFQSSGNNIIVITLHYTTLVTMIYIYICNMFNRRKDCYSINIVCFMTIPWWVSLHEKQSLIVLGTRSDPIITSILSMPWGVDEDEVVVLSTSIELVFLDQVCFKCLLVMLIDDGFSLDPSFDSLDPSFRVLLPSELASDEKLFYWRVTNRFEMTMMLQVEGRCNNDYYYYYQYLDHFYVKIRCHCSFKLKKGVRESRERMNAVIRWRYDWFIRQASERRRGRVEKERLTRESSRENEWINVNVVPSESR